MLVSFGVDGSPARPEQAAPPGRTTQRPYPQAAAGSSGGLARGKRRRGVAPRLAAPIPENRNPGRRLCGKPPLPARRRRRSYAQVLMQASPGGCKIAPTPSPYVS